MALKNNGKPKKLKINIFVNYLLLGHNGPKKINKLILSLVVLILFISFKGK